VAAASRVLARAFGVTNDPLTAVIHGLQALIDEADFAIYPGGRSASFPWLVHERAGLIESRPPAVYQAMPAERACSLERIVHVADRPVNLSTLTRQHPSIDRPETALQGFLDRVLHPVGWHHQLRTVLYQDGRILLFVGAYRAPGRAAFSPREHALLHALDPQLRRWGSLLGLLGRAPLGDGALVATLDAIEQPALILEGSEIVFANEIAGGEAWTAWRRAVARRQRPGGGARAGRLLSPLLGTEIELRAGFRLVLASGVTPPAPAAEEAGGPRALPPSLRRAHELLAGGLSDKEIALALGVSVATART
jgi:hypothetical protein